MNNTFIQGMGTEKYKNKHTQTMKTKKTKKKEKQKKIKTKHNDSYSQRQIIKTGQVEIQTSKKVQA